MPERPAYRRWRIVALVGVLAGALLLRLQAVAFGLPAMLDPDEPIFLLLAYRLIKNRTLNPKWFGHPGTTTIYCMALVEIGAFAAGYLTGQFPDSAAFGQAFYRDPSVVFIPARLFIVACGMGSILLTYFLGKRLFGSPAALIAAAALALDPLHIRYSQIIRTDMMASIFVLLVMLAAIEVARRGRARDYVLAGIALGLACATKWPAAACVVGVLGAAVLRAIEHPGERGQVVRRTIMFGAVAALSLIAVSPYLLLDYQAVIADLHGEARPFHLGATGHGFAGNLAWYLGDPLFVALGPLGLLASLAGFVIGSRQSRVFAATVVPVALVFTIMISAQALVWERWIVPILPLASIAMAASCVAAIEALRPRLSRLSRYAISLVAALAAITPLVMTGQGFARERENDTRLLATAWAREHIAAGSTVTVEHMAFDVLQQPWTFLYPAGDAGCVDVRANLHGEISYSQIGEWRGSRPVVDIGTMAPEHLASCRGDWAILVNWDRYRAEADRFPNEVASYERFAEPGRIVATFSPEPGRIGGPQVRIVRFDRQRSAKAAETSGR